MAELAIMNLLQNSVKPNIIQNINAIILDKERRMYAGLVSFLKLFWAELVVTHTK